MQHWQERDPRRLEKETELMLSRTRATLVRSSDCSLSWVEHLISEAGRPYTLVVSYPDRFPYERPQAFIVEPPIRPGTPHVLVDGSLCLFDDPWATDVKCTALVVRNRAVTWMLANEVWLAAGSWEAPQHGDVLR